jgi:hypothetical protein
MTLPFYLFLVDFEINLSAKSTSKVLGKTNTWLFDTSGHCIWNEQVLYQLAGSQNASDVLELIRLLGHEEGLLQWIKMS